MSQKFDFCLDQNTGLGKGLQSPGIPRNSEVRTDFKARLSVTVLLLLTTAAFAQPPPSNVADAADQNKQLADQITDLRGQVAKLQAAVQQAGSGNRASAKSGRKIDAAQGQGMGMMNDKSEMGMPPKSGMASTSTAMGMKDDEDEMGGTSPTGNAPVAPDGSMGDDKDEMGGIPMAGKNRAPIQPSSAMGMCCGGRAAAGRTSIGAMPSNSVSMVAMSGPSSAMPGQAGASHIYHIGSNGFFLNHSRHITLTPDQRFTLNQLKEKAMFESASGQRRVDQAEQDLYTLTGANQPDHAKIEAKLFEIEKLRAGERMNFIRSVEEASKVLTLEQREALLGTGPARK